MTKQPTPSHPKKTPRNRLLIAVVAFFLLLFTTAGMYWGYFAPVSMTLQKPLERTAPTTVEEANQRHQSGERWTTRQIRKVYVERAERIGELDAVWKQQGLSLEERARKAYAERKQARLVARAMMNNPAEIRALEERDRIKYGTPDGPSWDYLVQKGQKEGKKGDNLYRWIIASAQRTNTSVTRSVFR